MFECHSGIRNFKKKKGPSIESVDEEYNEAFVRAAPIGLAAHGQARLRCRVVAAQSGALASICMNIAYIIGYTVILSRISNIHIHNPIWRVELAAARASICIQCTQPRPCACPRFPNHAYKINPTYNNDFTRYRLCDLNCHE